MLRDIVVVVVTKVHKVMLFLYFSVKVVVKSCRFLSLLSEFLFIYFFCQKIFLFFFLQQNVVDIYVVVVKVLKCCSFYGVVVKLFLQLLLYLLSFKLKLIVRMLQNQKKKPTCLFFIFRFLWELVTRNMFCFCLKPKTVDGNDRKLQRKLKIL